MRRDYFIARLKEAQEEGWEKALATYDDDVAEASLFLDQIEEWAEEFSDDMAPQVYHDAKALIEKQRRELF